MTLGALERMRRQVGRDCGSLLPRRGVLPSASKLAHSNRPRTREGRASVPASRRPRRNPSDRGYARPPSAPSMGHEDALCRGGFSTRPVSAEDLGGLETRPYDDGPSSTCSSVLPSSGVEEFCPRITEHLQLRGAQHTVRQYRRGNLYNPAPPTVPVRTRRNSSLRGAKQRGNLFNRQPRLPPRGPRPTVIPAPLSFPRRRESLEPMIAT